MDPKKEKKKRLIIEGVIALLIAITPVLFYSYKYTPTQTETLDFFLFEMGSNGWGDARTALWYYLSKLIPMLLLIIWFVTCKQWWYHAILIPIAMYGFQFFTEIFNDTFITDESEILLVLAVTAVITPVVYFIRVRLVDKHVHGIDLKAMDAELRILKEKEELRKEREKLEQRQETLAKKS
ncbi:MAG: hypothetical protein ED555_11820 [Allomuricauda sp.]|nr:MAG: hypothetical protein ED555_11820 [Allomuricauda sp.]